MGESLAALAAQVAAQRSQVTLLSQRLDRAGITGDLNLAARFEELAQTAADALDAAAPRGPAAPCWIGLDRQAYAAQLDELRQWVDAVLRQHYGGYELRDCWPGHIHAVWELSTLAAAWHHAYGGPRPGVLRPLAARHHAPYRPHHPGMRTAMRHAPALLVIRSAFSGRVVVPVISRYATLAVNISRSLGLPIAGMSDR